VLRPGGVLYLQGPNRFSPQWFLGDPHYGLLGASILPPSLGRKYVEWRRGRKGYDVGVFPIGHLVVRTLERLGCSIVEPPALPSDPASDTALRRGRQWAWGHIRLAIGAMFTVVARRESIG
jgi:hypothetical protein